MTRKINSKIKNIIYVFFICVSFNINSAKADSPLTSTNLIAGYENLPIIHKLQQQKVMDDEVLDFLLSNASIDKKTAVINALGWNINGQNNGELFIKALLERKRINRIEELRLQNLTAEEKFVLGYLLAMDNYLQLSSLRPNNSQSILSATPLQLLSQAAFVLPDNFTVHFVKSLVEAQLYMSLSWCAVYLSPTEVLQRFPKNKRNLHPNAVTAVMKYMNLYQESCH